MRLNMNNHYGIQSVTADMENKDDDIEFRIIKKTGFVTKRIYYKIQLVSNNNRANLLLNTEQLERITELLNEYVSSGNYKKRTNAKASRLEQFLKSKI